MDEAMKPSRAYVRALEQAREHHLTSKTYSGKFLRPHAPIIKGIIQKIGATSVLDYGCGKGSQYIWVSHGGDASIPEGMTIEQYWGVPVMKYDPAYPPLANVDLEAHVKRHGKFGVTLVTHVLGSIPISDLTGWVIPRLAALTSGVVYIAEKIGEVGKQVFDDTAALPRWERPYWGAFISAASSMHRDVDWLLVTHQKREDGAKIMQRQYFRGGIQIG